MGRRKLIIQSLETMRARQAKYSKRKAGILKKAKDLSILCDVDVALLMFSPSDKPTLFVAHDKDLSDIVERLYNMPFEERVERRCYTMDVLKKIFANTESEFDTMNLWQDPKMEELRLLGEQLTELRATLAEKTKILRDWKNPNYVEDLSQITIMEDHLISTLQGLRIKKYQLAIEEQEILGGIPI